VDVERAQGVLVVGGDEDDRRDAVRAHTLEDVEAVEVRHLDVQEHEVGPQLFDRKDGLTAIPALAHDLDLRLLGKEAP